MKWVFLISLLCGLTAIRLVGAQTDTPIPDLLQQASAAYAAGDYPKAVSLYETVVKNQVTDGRVYFNLGNAYYQMGDLGYALLNYRRAQEVMPRDDDLKVNITRIRGERFDVQGDDTEFLNSLAALTMEVMTLNELSWLAFGLWTLCFVVIFIRILRAGWRETLRIPVVVIAMLLLTAAALLGSRLYLTLARPSAVVVEETVLVMSGPGDSYLKHFEIHSAAEIRVLESRGDWVRFALPDGRQGWIPEKSIARVLENEG